MAEPVRVGVVGASWWADGFHVPNLASHPRRDYGYLMPGRCLWAARFG